MRVAHNENFRVGVVSNHFEVVTGIPVVLFLININVLEVLLDLNYLAGIIFHMILNVGHHEIIKNLNLIILIGKVL